MSKNRRLRHLSILVLVPLLSAPAAVAQTPVDDAVATFEYTKNLKPQGIAERVPIFEPNGEGVGDRNSDIAFWGRYAFQGHFTGFRIIDISDHENPVEISNVEDCGVSRLSAVGGQGDVVVWDNVLVRS